MEFCSPIEVELVALAERELQQARQLHASRLSLITNAHNLPDGSYSFEPIDGKLVIRPEAKGTDGSD